MNQKKVNFVCARCGSSNVIKDAWAEWDIDSQRWTLHSTYDSCYCQDCQEDCRLEKVSVEPEDRLDG
ncbi:hypothetical protein D3C85_1778990 [compost metagenome]